jgi:UDP-glucuronate 4-epimerase
MTGEAMTKKDKSCILVTGGAGFIGSHLCEHLLRSDHKVVCVDNFNNFYDPGIKEQNISALMNNEDFSLVRADIRDKAGMAEIFKENNPDLVIHLAAMPGVRPSIINPFHYYDVNVNGTLTVLETMRRFNVSRMIFASSSSVYGNNAKIPFSESDPVDSPISPYASSKRACELLCSTYHSLYRFEISCLRFFTVYGPRQRPDLAIHSFTNKIIDDKPIQIYGDGNSFRDYTYIDDVLQGIGNSISRLKGFNIYNIGESRKVLLSEVIETLEDALGKKAIKEFLPFQAGDVNATYADISKAMRELDYKPSFEFKKGIAEFIRWKLGRVF